MKLAKTTLTVMVMLVSWLAEPQARAGVLFTNLVFFTFSNAPDCGWNFETENGRTCALVLGGDGNFYGTTVAGGLSAADYTDYTNYHGFGLGTVYKMTPSGSFTSLYSFAEDPISGLAFGAAAFYDGTFPLGNLVNGADGKLYGVTEYGGFATSSVNGVSAPTPYGTAFSITTNGTLSNLYSFGNNLNNGTNSDGRFPSAGLVQGRDGNFYGTTANEGGFGYGTVFQLTPSGGLTNLHSFAAPGTGNTDGNYPYSELVEGNDGTFYGATAAGGQYGDGTVFKITANGSFTPLVTFNGTNGSGCYGGLLLGRDGNFYGTTASGGKNGDGTVFKITTNGFFTNLYNFDYVRGAEPHGTLIQGSDGNLYGTTMSGGNFVGGTYHGTIFQVTTNGTLTTLYSFSGPDGDEPQGALVQASDGSFYGTTSYGGPGYDGSVHSGYGTIFRLSMPPKFQSITETNGLVTLEWKIVPGQTYELQYNTNLNSTNWLTLGDAISTNNFTGSVSDSIGTNARRFYRVMLVQ